MSATNTIDSRINTVGTPTISSRFGRLTAIAALAAGIAVIGFSGAASAQNSGSGSGGTGGGSASAAAVAKGKTPATPQQACAARGGTWHGSFGGYKGYCKNTNGDISVYGQNNEIAYICVPIRPNYYSCIG
jgi:hypothetical protein